MPLAGGALEQPAAIMDLFDFIDGVIAGWKEKQKQEAESESVKQDLLRKLKLGHG